MGAEAEALPLNVICKPFARAAVGLLTVLKAIPYIGSACFGFVSAPPYVRYCPLSSQACLMRPHLPFPILHFRNQGNALKTTLMLGPILCCRVELCQV